MANTPTRAFAALIVGGEAQAAERNRLLGALERHGGNVAQAARVLKIPRRTFTRLVVLYALRPDIERFRFLARTAPETLAPADSA
jgi:transcriptional regulator with GAF, ATPase, and Fis domain